MAFLRERLRFHLWSVVGTIALIVAIVLSVTRCNAIHTIPAEETTPQAIAERELDEDLAKQRRYYTQTTRSAIKLLMSRAWVSERTGAATWVSDTCLDTWEKDKETHRAFVVLASTYHATRDKTTYVLSVAYAFGYEVWTLEIPETTEGNEPGYELRGLGGTDVCRGVKKEGALKLDGPAESALEGRKTSAEAARLALEDYCADRHPEATVATWDGSIMEDHVAQEWRVGYTLDDVRETHVVLAIAMDTGELSVRRQR